MQISVNAIQFRTCLESVLIAMSSDTGRWLEGVRFEVKGKKLQMTATDGHRMHRASVPVTSASDETLKVEINGANLRNVAKALKAVKAPKRAASADAVLAAIRLGSGGLEIETTDTILKAGSYFDLPNFDAVIPEPSDRTESAKFGVNAEYMSDACLAAAKVNGGVARATVVRPGRHALAPLTVETSCDGSEFLAVVMPMRLD